MMKKILWYKIIEQFNDNFFNFYYTQVYLKFIIWKKKK